MRYGSVCSGIEAATVAWHPLGWQPAFFSEIEAFPRSVLAHHYPATPCHGDFTTIGADQYGAINLLVGGTPCQSFSVAGLRGGLDDDRGNLALEFLRLVDRKRPRWVVWENVPGVLSSNGGRDFGAILGGLGELGYGFAYRVLDAQFFGVPQRRRRVFVVGHFGDWRRAAAVLFERHSLQGHSAPRRETRQIAPTLPSRSLGGGGLGIDFDCDGGLIVSTGDTDHCLNAGGMGRQDYETETRIAHTLTSNGDAHSGYRDEEGLVPVSFGWQNSAHQGDGVSFDCFPTLDKSKTPAVALGQLVNGNQGAGGNRSWLRMDEPHQTLTRQANPNAIATVYAVRRLTPVECERLQGFPDDYTLTPHRGKPAADSPRYKALGNSMAVPVMAWIGERIAIIDALPLDVSAAA